jgi:hypothetical protein
MAQITYPFDPTGRASTNYVQNELHTVSESNYRDYYFIVPNFAPFYVTNFSLIYQVGDEQRALVENVDFNFALPYIAGIRTTGIPVYGAVTLNNLDLNGLLFMSYQCVGGDQVCDRLYVLGQLAEKLYNPRTTIWDTITDRPDVFAPLPHDHDFDRFYSQADFIEAINKISSAILNSQGLAKLTEHLLNFNNPHEVTKEQIGLGNVGNWRMASEEEAIAGIAGDVLMNPRTTSAAIRTNAMDHSAYQLYLMYHAGS